MDGQQRGNPVRQLSDVLGGDNSARGQQMVDTQKTKGATITERELPIEVVCPKPDQPRQYFDQDALDDLAASIGEVGLLQPILVRPNGDGFEIVHGERRWRACKLAGLETIRAEVRELSDSEAYTISVIENEQREDLSPIETARALKAMMGEGLTQAGVARRVSRGRSWVAQKLRLLNLPNEAQSYVKAGQLTEAHARQLLKLQVADLSDKIGDLAKLAASANWSVARLQSEVDVVIIGDDVSQDTPEPEDVVRLAFYTGAMCALLFAFQDNQNVS